MRPISNNNQSTQLPKQSNADSTQVRRPADPPGLTPIDDIPTDEEQEDDRHVNRPPPARMIQNSGNYEENPELFSGERPSMRKAKDGSVRAHVKKTRANDPNDIMSRADAMRKNREMIDTMKPGGGQM